VPVALAGLGTAGWTIGALGRVDAVEAERDRWQRPAVSAEVAEACLRAAGFEILGRDESFLTHASDRWWLIVARRPALLAGS
jgi:hypothetical protein